jgi:hypothetical protein
MVFGASDWWQFWEWTPAAWAAVGAWGALIYAVVQVGEARKLREEQARPWILVDFEPGFIFWLTIENIGRTVATDIRIRFRPDLASTQSRPWAWEESTLLTDGIPMLPPNKKLRAFFDSFPERLKSDLPMTYDVEVEYHGPTKQKKPLTSHYRLDLNFYVGMSPSPKGIPDLVKTLEDIKGEMHKWTDRSGSTGLRVSTADREKQERRLFRPSRLRNAKQIKESDGWLASIRYFIQNERRRRGLWVR